ncbi:MAG: hypothetical protein MUF07_15420 [Steroidobacteraceae bacterium]|jgi:hypothetical protein|nr:hypothetical protein [Steroidobacteraceae bacterium]
MRLPARLRFPALLTACGIASFAVVMALRWPQTPPSDVARSEASPREPEAGYEPADAAADPAPAQAAAPLVPDQPAPRHAPATNAAEGVDVTDEATEVMQPGPAPGTTPGPPGEEVELVEGEPVAAPR